MKRLLQLLLIFASMEMVQGQVLDKLTIDEAYRLAQANYPLTKQRELIARSEQYSLDNASKGILPVITIKGQDSYQSDVTSVPNQDPELSVPLLSKNQYKFYGEAEVNLYGGGAIRNEKAFHKVTARIDEQKLEVELYELKERINQLYFGILLLDGQVKQNELLKEDIKRGIHRTEAGIVNGIALKSSADVLYAEHLNADQKTIELQASRKAFIEMLSLMIGIPLNGSTALEKPKALTSSSDITRPELALYDHQRKAIDVQAKMLATRNLPKLSLFFQGGYGRPALDMLNNHPDAYYVTGLRFTWTISGFYTYKKEKSLLNLNQTYVDLRKQTFLFNTNLSLKNHGGEVSKLREVLATDDQIIALREKIKNTASAQLENGVIDSSDYLREVNAEDQARQKKILHEIQFLLAQYTLKTTAGI